MYAPLKLYCQTFITLNQQELSLIDTHFERKTVKKNEFLLQNGKVCNFVAFIETGCIRHFHIKNDEQKTCDISFENCWVTDFKSFTHNTPCIMNLQAMETTTINLIKKENLFKLYAQCATYETFGRIMAEQVAQRATEIAMSLSADKPEERFQNLIKNQPNILQRVPQKHIANFLGICAESLSRLRSRIITKEKNTKPALNHKKPLY